MSNVNIAFSILCLTQVCTDHVRVVADLFRRPVCQRRALVYHVDTVRNAHHQLHIMLNQQDGGVVMIAQFGNQLVQLFGLFRVKPCRRFIEHQDFWLRHHAAHDLQTTLVTVGQVAGLTVRMLQQADTIKPGGSAVERFILSTAEGRGFQQAREKAGFKLQVLRHQQVLYHRHLAEQTHVLEGTHHPHTGNLLARKPFQMLIAQLDGATRRLVETGQAVKDRGFPRAVRANQGDNLFLVQIQIHVVDGQQAAKTHHQAVNG
ncbi:hypothetical protein EcWSU1_04230 [Enterobacter ludwigii]|uniref:Uncharacterized protein n=1 Tax=Enterobacter ludwigii TaxID=299767 RepID=G8LJ33_9ENTR|nr:hypothetical protein EcWSU1_04230 [Enterobacter ludwigii]